MHSYGAPSRPIRAVRSAAAGSLLLVLAVGPVVSSTAPIERRYGGPGLDRGVHLTPTQDGGLVVVGVTDSAGAGGEDAWLLRTDGSGERLWERTLGGSADDHGWAVLETGDGYRVVGSTRSVGAGGWDCWLVATDREGRERWSRSYGGPEDDRCWGVTPTEDGGLLFVGETRSTGAGEEDCLLVRTDGTGEVLWQTTRGGTAGDRCFAVAPVTAGGFVVAGQSYSYGAGDRDAWVLGIDDAGELLWSRTFGGPASDVAHSVAPTPDGDLLVTGYTASFVDRSLGAIENPYLLSLTPSGRLRWSRVLPFPGVVRTLTGEPTADGNLCLGGVIAQRGEGSGALLVRADRRGDLERWWRFSATEDGRTLGYTARARDGGCVLVGHTTAGGGEDLDLLLVLAPAEDGDVRSPS